MERLPKLRESTFWLLSHMAGLYALGLGMCGPRRGEPHRGPKGVGRATLRGLVRRHWVEERNGLFYLTDAGAQAAAVYRDKK